MYRHPGRQYSPQRSQVPVVQFIRQMNATHRWDTSTETVRRLYDYLTEHRQEFVGE
ncbi:hypothetical protein GCM10028775_35150 [Catellatospora paridis]